MANLRAQTLPIKVFRILKDVANSKLLEELNSGLDGASDYMCVFNESKTVLSLVTTL